jgi:hypothetical protein
VRLTDIKRGEGSECVGEKSDFQKRGWRNKIAVEPWIIGEIFTDVSKCGAVPVRVLLRWRGSIGYPSSTVVSLLFLAMANMQFA